MVVVPNRLVLGDDISAQGMTAGVSKFPKTVAPISGWSRRPFRPREAATGSAASDAAPREVANAADAGGGLEPTGRDTASSAAHRARSRQSVESDSIRDASAVGISSEKPEMGTHPRHVHAIAGDRRSNAP